MVDRTSKEVVTEEAESDLAALRAREQDLTDFVENASLGLHWVGPDGTILWANRSELELLGYRREEYVGHNITEFHVDSPVIEDILRRLTNHETLHNYEARLRTRDGGIRHVQISSNVRWNETGEFVHTRCFTRDVTDRKRYERRLLTQYGVGHVLSGALSLEAAAPLLLQLIGGNLGWHAGFLWIPEDGSLHCRAAWQKDPPALSGFGAACREFTLPPGVGFPGRILTRAAADWIADLRMDTNFPRLQIAVQEGLRSAFGFPLMIGNEVLGVLEFFTDEVTAPDDDLLHLAASLGYQIGEFLERTSAQAKLAEREESFRVLTETASDGIVTIDATNTILFVNSAAAKLFGYTSEELIGASLTTLMPEYMRPLHQNAMASYVETGKQHRPSWQAISLPGQHRHGHEIPLEISFGEYREGKKHIFVGVLRDITERNRLEASVRQAAKLESLGVLAGGIAHDFNNLLTGILGNVSLAQDLLPADDAVRAILDSAMEASERAADLTRQMLAYAGKGRFLVEPVNISGLVRQISALVQSSIPKHVMLRLDLDASIPMVNADASQLQQLIMNLIINGAEAIPEDRVGRLLVKTRYRHVDTESLKQFGSGEIPSGQYIDITVSDNGHGIDDATMLKIFDPFFTTKFTGRGLGLAAALGIVRGHRGALRVTSIPAEGTTFRVFLPPSAAVAPMDTRPSPVLSVPMPGSGTVLVVDDEPIVLRLAVPSLTRHGYTVIAAENGRVGVERFRELHEQLALVILDMTMPVMNGEQALLQMNAIDAGVPVVLSSGYNEREATERFKEKQLAGFLQKPYTSSQLAEKVRLLSRKV